MYPNIYQLDSFQMKSVNTNDFFQTYHDIYNRLRFCKLLMIFECICLIQKCIPPIFPIQTILILRHRYFQNIDNYHHNNSRLSKCIYNLNQFLSMLNCLSRDYSSIYLVHYNVTVICTSNYYFYLVHRCKNSLYLNLKGL